MPPFFKLTLVVLCAYILWTFNHPDNHIESTLPRRPPRYVINGRYPNGGDPRGFQQAPSIQNAPVPDVSSIMTVSCDNGPSKNVAFLKTHKTGSSTMSNIMLRFADTHNLTVGLPLEGKWELGGYPAYIDKQLIDPQLQQYNILGHHFRFNKEKLDQFMPADTKYVTIIRSPVDNVESVFGFFQDQMPFEEWLGDVNATDRLKTFYADPNKYFVRETDWYFRSKNHMFFDIGYDVNRAEEQPYVQQAISEMDNHFTLILLTDFFDESLILMKHLLCWGWDDIVYIKFKMRIEEAKAEVNVDLSERIKKWNHADFMLYDYFNKTFWQKVDAFGRDKMEAELVTFREQQKLAEEECIESYQPFKKKPWILGAKLRPHPTDKCKHLAWSETVYGEFLRDKMYKTIPGLMKQTEEQKTASLALFEQVAGGALRSR
jgi:galactosylceramide sulfotransferase